MNNIPARRRLPRLRGSISFTKKGVRSVSYLGEKRGMREWEIQIFALRISEGRTLGRASITKPIYSLGSGGSRSSPRLLSSSSNNVHTVKAPWRRKTIQGTPHHGHTHPDLQKHAGSGLRGGKQLGCWQPCCSLPENKELELEHAIPQM